MAIVLDVTIALKRFTVKGVSNLEKSKLDRGFTKVPNILLNSVIKGRFTGVELKLIMVIWRYTNGFMRDSAELPISFLANEIGSSSSVVSRQITRLINCGVIKVLYTNPTTKVRALMLNNDIENWGTEIGSDVDRQVNTQLDRTVNRGVDHTVNSGVDRTVNYLLTARSSNKDNINILLYKNIKERVNLSEKLEVAVIRWLEYKTERREYYSKISLKALVATILDKVKVWGDDEVIEVINDCIISGYKNIVWEKLKIRNIRKSSFSSDFQESYDHMALEKLSRGIEDDE